MRARTFTTALIVGAAFSLTAAARQATQPAAPARPAGQGATAPARPASAGMGAMKMPSDADLIKSATAAAPPAIASSATVIAMDDKMQVKTLRKGTNGWTCMPDQPNTPGPDAMCVDQYGLEWVNAWIGKKNPPAGKMGFGYMLTGGSDASNTDPFAEKPAPGHQWIDTGPHVMVFNPGTAFTGYPKTPDNPKAPFVMFPGTPYEHLMIPVR
jgi:hypothetical protein